MLWAALLVLARVQRHRLLPISAALRRLSVLTLLQQWAHQWSNFQVLQSHLDLCILQHQLVLIAVVELQLQPQLQ